MTKTKVKTQAKTNQPCYMFIQKGAIARLSKIFGKAYLIYFALIRKLPNSGRIDEKDKSANIVTCRVKELEKDGIVAHAAVTNGLRTLESIGLIRQVDPGEFHGRRPHRFEILRVPGNWR